MHQEKPAGLLESTEKMPVEENEHRPAQEELQPGGLESSTTEANTTTESGAPGANPFPSQDNGNLLGQQELQLGGLEPFSAFPDDAPGAQNLE